MTDGFNVITRRAVMAVGGNDCGHDCVTRSQHACKRHGIKQATSRQPNSPLLKPILWGLDKVPGSQPIGSSLPRSVWRGFYSPSGKRSVEDDGKGVLECSSQEDLSDAIMNIYINISLKRQTEMCLYIQMPSKQ